MNAHRRHQISRLAATFALGAILLPAASWAAGASSSAANVAKARLIRPLSIVTKEPLNFGTLIKNDMSGDVSIVLATNAGSAPTITSSDPAGVFPLPGSGADDAGYDVAGEPGALIQVTVAPASFDIQTGAGGTSATLMTVSALDVTVFHAVGQASILNNGQFNMFPDGNAFLEVGGTLTVKPVNVLGIYSGSFTVTVSYV
jgi:hypothetical protein